MKAILHSKSFYYLLACLLVLAVPHLAFAQAASGSTGFPFSVPQSDLSKQYIIDTMFGPISPGATNPQNPLGSLLGTFSAICLAIGGVMVAYTLFAGTLVTAHEGQILGKKWSSLWLPLRITLGSAILIPVKGMGGFCVLQAIVIWLALQGVGAANTIWTAYLDSNPIVSMGTFSDSSTLYRNFVTNVAYSALCLNYQQARFATLSKEPGFSNMYSTKAAQFMTINHISRTGAGQAGGGDPFYSGAFPQDSSETNFGFPGISDCGMIFFPADWNATDKNPIVMTAAPSTQADYLQHIYQVVAATTTSIKSIRATDTTAMIAAVNTAAHDVAVSYDANGSDDVAFAKATANLNKVIDDQVAKYASDVATAGKSAYNITNGGLDPNGYLKSNGWLTAGVYYMFFTKLSEAIHKEITALPNYSAPRFPLSYGWFSVSKVDASGNSSDSIKAWAMKRTSLDFANVLQLPSPVPSPSSSDSNSAPDPNGGYASDIVKYFNKSNFSGALSEQAASAISTNPIILVANVGHAMMNASWFFLVAGGAVSFVNSALGNLGLSIFGMLIVPGMMFSYFIPALPFIIWMGAVFGWMVLLIEAVIAAPLWALAHLFPDGDGIVGRAGQGYMLVLSLMLKPALMIIGLVAALVIIDPIGKVVNLLFLTAGSGIMSGPATSSTQVFGVIAGLIIFVTLMLSLVRRTFDLIHIIPDTVLRWLGAPGGRELGDNAQAAASSERGVLTAMGGMKLASDFAGGASAALRAPGKKLGSSIFNRNQKNAAARKEKVNSMRSDAAGKLASAEQAGAYARMGSAADRERGAEKLIEASMDQSVAQSASAAGKGQDVSFKPTGVKELDSVSAGLSQRQIGKGAGYGANRQHLLDNLANLENNSDGSPSSIAAIGNAKSALDKFDESAMDVMKKHVAANHGDAGGLSAAAASVYAASQHRDDRNTAKLERLGGNPGRGGGEVSANMQKANDALAAAVKADPSIAAKASSMGGVEKFLGAVQNDPSLASPIARPYLDSARQHHSTAQSLADEFSTTAKSMGMSDADISATRPSVAFQEPSPTGDLFG